MPAWVEPLIAVAVIFFLVFLILRGEAQRARATVARSEATAGSRPALTADVGEMSRPVTVTTSASSSTMKVAESAHIDGATDVRSDASSSGALTLPKMEYEEDDDVDPTLVGDRATTRSVAPVPVMRILYDADAEVDEPTQPTALILVAATAQTDKGMRRRRNEDSLLVMASEGIYVVADGMGGYRGGEIASQLAVSRIEQAFRSGNIEGEPHDNLPRRASELVRAVQLANEAIGARAAEQQELAGMGTTICAARFSLHKQRLYVAHVGDSRMYRVRAGVLRQMTSDHTMEASFGVKGEGAAHLSRAVGVWPVVPVDVLLGKPLPGDTYLICSDGLTKMLDDNTIAALIRNHEKPTDLVERLVEKANASGGKDNITVIVVRVYSTASQPA